MTYNGDRRAPNVSQYLANLNTTALPPTHDLPSDLPLADSDLDFLTHAEFFDFDSFNPGNVDFHGHAPHDADKAHRMPVNGNGFQYGEFQAYPPTVGSSPTSNLHGAYPSQPNHAMPYGAPQAGDKRKASVTNTIASPADLEEQSRMAAEEDKRRRNTAASARFRIKKKQREQALEKQAKDMSDKVSQLENTVQQLRMENKWLKGLITDKNDGKSLETMQKEKESEARKLDGHTSGVGTSEDDAVADDDEDEDEY